MSLLEAIVLGLVQGLTEFLPVSSSGHLVLVQELLGVDMPGVTFEILVHFGTLLSVVIYFWKRLWRIFLSILPPFRPEYAQDRRTLVYLFIASIPAGIIGLSPLKDRFEGLYDKPLVVSILLIVTGGMLFLPRVISHRQSRSTSEAKEVGALSALIMGLGQAFAILPGISRSGSTIVAGMLAKVKPSAAAEFSFLMAIPAIFVATLLETKHIQDMDPAVMMNCTIAALVAFVSGLFAIYGVLSSIRKGKFEYFGIYCLIAGTLTYFLLR